MKRTDQQRKAIEVLCKNTAEALNDAGYDQKAVLEKKVISVSNTQESVKETIFKAIAFAMFQKKSTTELTTGEVNEVYEVMNRWLAEQFGISVEFPHEGEL